VTRAVLYARRSKEEPDADPGVALGALATSQRAERRHSNSVETQLAGGRAYAASLGWEVVAEFVDDGVSRAEFQKRTGLIGLLNLAERRGFDVAITRDSSRLGGDMVRAGLVIQDLRDHGAKLHYYADGGEVRLDDATQQLIQMIKNYGAQVEREKIASRTRENLERRARAGLVAGGVAFGHRNVEKDGGKVRVLHEPEVAVLREMAARYVAGEGIRRIAHALNEQRIPSARAGKRGTSSWSSSAVWSMLHNPIYIGQFTWGRTHKAYRKGTKVRLGDHDHEVITVEIPELRVFDEATWSAIQAKGKEYAARFGTASRGNAGHLLTGLVRCAVCNGPLVVSNAKVSYDNVRVYGCGWHRDRGNVVCGVTLRRPVSVVDEIVLRHLREEVLTPRLLHVVMAEVRRLTEERTRGARQELPGLEDEQRRLRAELDRLVGALASGAASSAVMGAIADRETMLRAVEKRIAAAAVPVDTIHLGARRMEREARARLDDFQGLLSRNRADARRVMEQLLPRPLVAHAIATAEGPRFELRGEIGLVSLVGSEFSSVCVPSGDRTELNHGTWAIPVQVAA
jgi:site-specific DNA recombinase